MVAGKSAGKNSGKIIKASVSMENKQDKKSNLTFEAIIKTCTDNTFNNNSQLDKISKKDFYGCAKNILNRNKNKIQKAYNEYIDAYVQKSDPESNTVESNTVFTKKERDLKSIYSQRKIVFQVTDTSVVKFTNNFVDIIISEITLKNEDINDIYNIDNAENAKQEINNMINEEINKIIKEKNIKAKYTTISQIVDDIIEYNNIDQNYVDSVVDSIKGLIKGVFSNTKNIMNIYNVYNTYIEIIKILKTTKKYSILVSDLDKYILEVLNLVRNIKYKNHQLFIKPYTINKNALTEMVEYINNNSINNNKIRLDRIKDITLIETVGNQTADYVLKVLQNKLEKIDANNKNNSDLINYINTCIKLFKYICDNANAYTGIRDYYNDYWEQKGVEKVYQKFSVNSKEKILYTLYYYYNNNIQDYNNFYSIYEKYAKINKSNLHKNIKDLYLDYGYIKTTTTEKYNTNLKFYDDLVDIINNNSEVTSQDIDTINNYHNAISNILKNNKKTFENFKVYSRQINNYYNNAKNELQDLNHFLSVYNTVYKSNSIINIDSYIAKIIFVIDNLNTQKKKIMNKYDNFDYLYSTIIYDAIFSSFHGANNVNKDVIKFMNVLEKYGSIDIKNTHNVTHKYNYQNKTYYHLSGDELLNIIKQCMINLNKFMSDLAYFDVKVDTLEDYIRKYNSKEYFDGNKEIFEKYNEIKNFSYIFENYIKDTIDTINYSFSRLFIGLTGPNSLESVINKLIKEENKPDSEFVNKYLNYTKVNEPWYEQESVQQIKVTEKYTLKDLMVEIIKTNNKTSIYVTRDIGNLEDIKEDLNYVNSVRKKYSSNKADKYYGEESEILECIKNFNKIKRKFNNKYDKSKQRINKYIDNIEYIINLLNTLKNALTNNTEIKRFLKNNKTTLNSAFVDIFSVFNIYTQFSTNRMIYEKNIKSMIEYYGASIKPLKTLIESLQKFNSIYDAVYMKVYDILMEIRIEKAKQKQIETIKKSGLKHDDEYKTGKSQRNIINDNSDFNDIKQQLIELYELKNNFKHEMDNVIYNLSLSTNILSSNIDLYTFAEKAAQAFIEAIMHYDGYQSVITYAKESSIIKKYGYNMSPTDALRLSGELLNNTKLICYTQQDKHNVDIYVNNNAHKPEYKQNNNNVISNAELWHILEYDGWNISTVFYKNMKEIDDLKSDISMNYTTDINNIIINKKQDGYLVVNFYAGVGEDKIIYLIDYQNENNKSVESNDNVSSVFKQIVLKLYNNKTFMKLLTSGINDIHPYQTEKTITKINGSIHTADKDIFMIQDIDSRYDKIVDFISQLIKNKTKFKTQKYINELYTYVHRDIKTLDDIKRLYLIITELINTYDNVANTIEKYNTSGLLTPVRNMKKSNIEGIEAFNKQLRKLGNKTFNNLDADEINKAYSDLKEAQVVLEQFYSE